MNNENNFLLSTSPTTLPARKPRLTARAFYRSTRRRYSGKEQDSETGLHYYGARYLDSKTGRWLSGDPALGEYVPQAGTNGDELPGMGGVYNTVNLHLYHYAGNNPVLLKDPNGKIIQALGDDKNTYTWDNEKNQFYSIGWDNNRNYEVKDDFVNSVQDSLVYLKESEYGSQIIEELSSSNKYALAHRGTENAVNKPGFPRHRNINITFNPDEGLDLKDGTGSSTSPAISLFHELSHSYSHIIENKMNSRLRNKNVATGNKDAEEVNAMAMTDRAARQLGEPLRNGPYIQAKGRAANSVTDFKNNQR